MNRHPTNRTIHLLYYSEYAVTEVGTVHCRCITEHIAHWQEFDNILVMKKNLIYVRLLEL